MPKPNLDIIVKMRRIMLDKQYSGEIYIKGLDHERQYKVDYTLMQADKKDKGESPVIFVNLKDLTLSEELYEVFNMALMESRELLEARIEAFGKSPGMSEIGLCGGYARDFDSKSLLKFNGQPNNGYLKNLSSDDPAYKIPRGFEIKGTFNIEELFSELPQESLLYLKRKLQVKALQKKQI
jgi:hypothetical protein